MNFRFNTESQSWIISFVGLNHKYYLFLSHGHRVQLSWLGIRKLLMILALFSHLLGPFFSQWRPPPPCVWISKMRTVIWTEFNHSKLHINSMTLLNNQIDHTTAPTATWTPLLQPVSCLVLLTYLESIFYWCDYYHDTIKSFSDNPFLMSSLPQLPAGLSTLNTIFRVHLYIDL